MATNLVHNAIVHNLPDQGTVWVTTSVHRKTVALTIENTGEKLTPQLVSTLGEPFLRGTERVRTDHAGVGLGLAIVKSITQAHEGTLTLPPGPLEGSASRCNYPPRHRTMADYDQVTARPKRDVGIRARKSEPGSPSSLYDVFRLAVARRDARLKAAPQRVPNTDMMSVTSSAGGAAGTGSGPYLTKSSRTCSENGCPSTCPVSDTMIRRTRLEESTHASIGR
jgi:hypothetical protein